MGQSFEWQTESVLRKMLSSSIKIRQKPQRSLTKYNSEKNSMMCSMTGLSPGKRKLSRNDRRASSILKSWNWNDLKNEDHDIA